MQLCGSNPGLEKKKLTSRQQPPSSEDNQANKKQHLPLPMDPTSPPATHLLNSRHASELKRARMHTTSNPQLMPNTLENYVH